MVREPQYTSPNPFLEKGRIINLVFQSIIYVSQEERTLNIRPLHDRVVVKRLDSDDKSAGGIVLPGSAQEKPVMGEIVAAGAGRVLDNGDKAALDVKTGDKVLFGKFAGTEVTIDGEDYLVMREDDLFAVVE